MATIDFTTPTGSGGCGAPTDGVSSCATAVDNWLTFAWNPSNAPPTLTINGLGVTNQMFNLGSSAILNRGVVGATITGSNGAKVDYLSLGTPDSVVGAGDNSHPTRAYIQSVSAGSSTVTLVTSSEASKFVVGQWGVVAGLETQPSGGAPPNYQFFEWRKITAINGGVLTLNAPLEDSYKSTWPYYTTANNGPAAFTAVGGSAATLDSRWTSSAMAPVIESTTTVNDLIVTVGCSGYPGGNVVLNNVDFSGAVGPAPGSSEAFSPSQSRSWILNNCPLALSNEFDKWLGYLEFNNCDQTGAINFKIQSGSPRVLLIRNGCSIGNASAGGIGGLGRFSTIQDSTIGGFFVGSQSYGRSESLAVSNVTMTGNYGAGIQSNLQWPRLDSASLTNMGSGLFRMAKAGFLEGVMTRAIPGHWLIMTRFANNWPLPSRPDGGGNPIVFKITDVYDDATYYFIQTDIVDRYGATLPTPTFGTQAYDGCFGIELKSYSGPAFPTQNITDLYVSPFDAPPAVKVRGTTIFAL